MLYVYAFDILSANQCICPERPSLKLFFNLWIVFSLKLKFCHHLLTLLLFSVFRGTQNAKTLFTLLAINYNKSGSQG